MVNEPTPDEIQKFILEAHVEFGLDYTPEEARKLIIEYKSEGEAMDRK